MSNRDASRHTLMMFHIQYRGAPNDSPAAYIMLSINDVAGSTGSRPVEWLHSTAPAKS